MHNFKITISYDRGKNNPENAFYVSSNAFQRQMKFKFWFGQCYAMSCTNVLSKLMPWVSHLPKVTCHLP